MLPESVDSSNAPLWSSSRSMFLRSLRAAIKDQQAFAAAKLGFSEQVWLAGSDEVYTGGDIRFDRARRAAVRFHACRQIGVFPESDEYLADSVEAFADSAANLDFLAVHESSLVTSALSTLARVPRLIDFNDLEPNRESPYDVDNCYLSSLRDRRVLLITSPAELLASRATPEVFTAVWRAIGCPWFAPQSVSALPFPSLFSSETRNHFSSSRDILTLIIDQLSDISFDVALVAAGSLGIPIVDHVRSLGRVGISLGAHLQVLFGVQGRRWREDPEWQRAYANEAWIDMPEGLHSAGTRWVADDGAYW